MSARRRGCAVSVAIPRRAIYVSGRSEYAPAITTEYAPAINCMPNPKSKVSRTPKPSGESDVSGPTPAGARKGAALEKKPPAQAPAGPDQHRGEPQHPGVPLAPPRIVPESDVRCRRRAVHAHVGFGDDSGRRERHAGMLRLAAVLIGPGGRLRRRLLLEGRAFARAGGRRSGHIGFPGGFGCTTDFGFWVRHAVYRGRILSCDRGRILAAARDIDRAPRNRNADCASASPRRHP